MGAQADSLSGWSVMKQQQRPTLLTGFVELKTGDDERDDDSHSAEYGHRGRPARMGRETKLRCLIRLIRGGLCIVCSLFASCCEICDPFLLELLTERLVPFRLFLLQFCTELLVPFGLLLGQFLLLLQPLALHSLTEGFLPFRLHPVPLLLLRRPLVLQFLAEGLVSIGLLLRELLSNALLLNDHLAPEGLLRCCLFSEEGLLLLLQLRVRCDALSVLFLPKLLHLLVLLLLEALLPLLLLLHELLHVLLLLVGEGLSLFLLLLFLSCLGPFGAVFQLRLKSHQLGFDRCDKSGQRRLQRTRPLYGWSSPIPKNIVHGFARAIGRHAKSF